MNILRTGKNTGISFITRYTFEDGRPEILVFVEHTENKNNVAHALAFLKAAQKEWGGTITREHKEVIS